MQRPHDRVIFRWQDAGAPAKKQTMNGCNITFAGAALTALGSGALWWPEQRLLCVSDLHLGKSDRMVRRFGVHVPPYETRDTLTRLAQDMDATGAKTVVCLGDSFDDPAAADALSDEDGLWVTRLQAGRRWIWIEGNHDPGPVGLGGTHLNSLRIASVTFRHIATSGETSEISGHYHPKAQISLRGRVVSRAAFLMDADRLIMPAYGTYTGGLRSSDPVLSGLMRADATAILTGPVAHHIPMPRQSRPAPSRSG